MKRMRNTLGAALLTASLALTGSTCLANDDKELQPPPKMKDCDMTYTLKGWSAVYKTAHGKGTITCSNGQTAKVKLSVHGGGLTFGKSEIFDGKGEISGVKSINQIFGSYAAGEAHAGVVKSASGTVLTKGNVSIALFGTGSGVDLGVDFSKFTIEKVK